LIKKTLQLIFIAVAIIIILGIVAVYTSFTPDISFIKNLGGSGVDNSHSIQQTSDGGYNVAGINTSGMFLNTMVIGIIG